MTFHLEITGDASRHEWRAIAALTAVMLGTTAAAAIAPDSEDETVVLTEHGKIAVSEFAAVLPIVFAPPVAENEPPVIATIPPPPVPASSSAVLFDQNGLPWDGRIHASTKTTTASGGWTKKRGVDADLVRHVEAELRNIMAAPPAPAGVVPPPPTVEAVSALDPAAMFGGASPTPADAPPSAQPSAAAEFARVMRIVNAKQAAGLMSTEMSTAIAQQLGLTKVGDFMLRADLLPAFEALLP